jgi:hypothetical protein
MFTKGIVLSSLLALLLTTPLLASVAIPAEISALVSDAQAIVHGRVVRLEGRASGDGLGIETLVTIEAESYLKGDLGREVTVVVVGGQLGRYRSVVSGAPQFAEGQEVVLFLGAKAPALPHIVRLSQGAFRVSVDRRTGARTIRRQPLAGQAATWQKVQRGAGAPDGVSLPAFGAMVRTAMEKSR